ncbi:unnamed protein product [Nippostrongylus brasiliensis]|uniref:CID domain-containing protein n=1 Tax=Nippostrongylus brasiliensis TaxID=27835 RepID=A0A0N4YLW6_NIPBR|nr:unnamed protein product [Nippostrongylus brasiliensis]
MDDEQLRELFTSLATLAQQGPIPVQAYSVLVHNHSPEALAEQLHQKWLADYRFAPIAANIVLHVRKTSSSGVALSSCVLALLLNDYRNRLEVFGVLLREHGATLNNLNSYLIDRLIVKMRAKICSDEPEMNGELRGIYLHVLDLWAWGWNPLMIPECLTMPFTDPVEKETSPQPQRKRDVGKKEFGSKESIV